MDGRADNDSVYVAGRYCVRDQVCCLELGLSAGCFVQSALGGWTDVICLVLSPSLSCARSLSLFPPSITGSIVLSVVLLCPNATLHHFRPTGL